MTARQRITTGLGAAVLAGSLVVPIAGHGALASDRGSGQGAAIADKQPAPDAQIPPSELAREGMAKMLQALNKLIESVPQFQMPEINENGDIILRRKNPPDAPVPPAQSPNQLDKRAI
jgi:hypothetical protein